MTPQRQKSVARSKPTAAGDRQAIVGIGTSAGGLQALEQFFRHVPERSGLAYVVVQHLDPTHKGMLPELLARFTDMKVIEVNRRIRVRPDCLYVIPPNKSLSIAHGALSPAAPDAPRGLRLPVDRFFRELAAQNAQRSIGVILSGMGSDGTLGVRAIKDQGGLVAVQEPTDAGFDGMPRSAIATRLADIIAPARELPMRIIHRLNAGTGAESGDGGRVDQSSQDDVARVLDLMRARTGHEFQYYKKNSVHRRLERRLSVHRLPDVAAYARFVEANPQELDLLFKELLIGVTAFLRDPAAWDLLKSRVLPTLIRERPGGGTLRAWVSACSTGEEAYSLAMIFQEVLEEIRPPARHSLQIFATDVDRDAIDKARKGVYPAGIDADLGARRLERYFQAEGASFRVRPLIREMITFAPQDILLDPPFTRLDLLLCRNVLIYLAPSPQSRLLALFHYSLRPNGILFLGTAETIGSHNELFEAIDPKQRLFRRRVVESGQRPAFDPPVGRLPVTLSGSEDLKPPKGTVNLAALADQVLLQQFCPASVLVNQQGDILYINGRTGKYLEPATGQANWNVHAMAREGLRPLLSAALHQAAQQTEPVLHHAVSVGTNGGTQWIDLSVRAVQSPTPLRGMFLIVFTELPPKTVGRRVRKRSGAAQPTDAEVAVREAREELRRMYEDMQSAQEELKSANEELQSTNEELQSTNEELTTSKEEMQSMNEELQTVNAELQSKLDELTRTSNDMKNLLDSTDIATVFLDSSLRVRRFTTHATEIFKLIPGDVNRPLSDIVSELDYPELQQDVAEVLRTLVYCEKEIAASRERWFKARVMPYRTADDRIDGVVITFSNITEHKRREAQWRRGAGTP